MKTVFLLLCFMISSVYRGVEGKPQVKGVPETGPPIASGPDHDVTKYGATLGTSDDTTEDGDSANALAFIRAWRAACDSVGATRLVIPKGSFVTGPVLFAGPCKAKVTVEIIGTVLANTDITLYAEPHVILFENVDGVTFTGTGVVDGQGAKHWQNNDCAKNHNCSPLPTSIKFHRVTNGVIEGVQSVNSMFFHMFITNCHNVTIRNVKIAAPFNSPNTDGIHVGESDLVTITNSLIGTGDDCISVGHGSKQILITGVTCGPGHGISIGSLGKYDKEQEVAGVHVMNCTLSGTTNGARIKSWPGNKPNKASAIIFEDLVMDHVKNPIIIDQQYGKKDSTQGSHVKISDVHFKNIRGTSATVELVTFACSPAMPCEGIEVADVSLTFDGKAVMHKQRTQVGGKPTTCLNAKVIFTGKHEGLACI